MQATWEEPGGLQLLCIEMQWSVAIVLSLEILLFRDYRNHHAMHPAGRLAAQLKTKHCMLVFVFSMDAPAQHVNYVILSVCLYPVCRPVPAEKEVKIYGVGPERQQWSNKPITIWKLKNLDYL